MGVDVPNIRTVIHYGPSSDTDDYVQEAERAGRDSHAILYKYPYSMVGREQTEGVCSVADVITHAPTTFHMQKHH